MRGLWGTKMGITVPQETEANLDSFTYHFASIQVPADKVIIDCTASTAVPCFYAK